MKVPPRSEGEATKKIPCPKCGAKHPQYNDGCYYPDFDCECESCYHRWIHDYDDALQYRKEKEE